MVFHESHLGEKHRRETSIMESSDKIYLISQATRENKVKATRFLAYSAKANKEKRKELLRILFSILAEEKGVSLVSSHPHPHPHPLHL